MWTGSFSEFELISCLCSFTDHNYVNLDGKATYLFFFHVEPQLQRVSDQMFLFLLFKTKTKQESMTSFKMSECPHAKTSSCSNTEVRIHF